MQHRAKIDTIIVQHCLKKEAIHMQRRLEIKVEIRNLKFLMRGYRAALVLN